MSARGVITSPTRRVWNAWAWLISSAPARLSALASGASRSRPEVRPNRPSKDRQPPTRTRGPAVSSAVLDMVSRLQDVAIGIDDAESGERARLQRLHVFGFLVGLMIIAHQMKDAMDGQVAHVIGQGLALGRRFPRADTEGEDHLADGTVRSAGGGKRQDVGRRPGAPETSVELAHRGAG